MLTRLPFALLDSNHGAEQRSRLLRKPVAFVIGRTVAEIPPALKALQTHLDQGFYVCGYLSYEAGAAFGLEGHTPGPTDQPLLNFGVFAQCEQLDEQEVDAFLTSLATEETEAFHLDLKLQSDFASYQAHINQIMAALTSGESYQVNYTTKYEGWVAGNITALYRALRRAQTVAYGAYLHFPNLTLLSRSPELFFKKQGQTLITKPMKGTIKRIIDDINQDQIAKDTLHDDAKQRAENIMIVDLLRNDMGKIAQAGSVKVDKLFDIETYETVHQMTSSISCKLNDDARTLPSIMAALFPCGSITGAPKHRTSEIIKSLEPHPRGVYTGTIGVCEPNGDMTFNVAIRTLSIDSEQNCSFGVGSGIVIDSQAATEFEECKLKADFITQTASTIRLIETFKYTPQDGLHNYPLHKARLIKSCQDLGFPLPSPDFDHNIEKFAKKLRNDSKIRFEYSRQGTVDLSAQPLSALHTGPKYIALAKRRISSKDRLRQYKTTARSFLDLERIKHQQSAEIYDVIFANEYDHLTEASYHSLFLKFGETYHTPPLKSGVLDGIGRQLFMQKNAGAIVERPLPLSVLGAADAIVLVSSIRGINPVMMAPHA